MWPGSLGVRLHLSHPDSQYFAVAKMEKDQVEALRTKRKGWDLKTAERWLAPNLGTYRAETAGNFQPRRCFQPDPPARNEV